MKSESPLKRSTHLGFLDGIRGITAMYVVMYHIYHEVMNYQIAHVEPARLMFMLQKMFAWGGHDSVTVFICLSGFSLTIPLAKNSYASLSKLSELRNYFLRRFLRIGPPYFVCIAIIVALAWVYPILSTPTQTSWNTALPILDLKTIVLHILFVHSLDSNHIFRISPQFWSIGTEAQIYIWLPAVLVPLAVRKSMLWGVGASLLACLIFIPLKGIESACLHYVFTFSIGALAADFTFNPQRCNRTVNRSEIFAIAVLFLAALATGQYFRENLAVLDLSLSPLIAFVLYILAKQRKESNPGLAFLRSLLGSPLFTFLGKISYSVYLVHYIVIAMLHTLLLGKSTGPQVTVLCLVFIAPLLTILTATILQFLVEAPSMKLAKNFRDQDQKKVLA